MYDIQIDWWKLINENSAALFNIVSVELGLLLGMWIRGRFIDNTKMSNQKLRDFGMFSLALVYGTILATLYNWSIPAYGYFLGGVALPPLTVPLYNGAILAAPSILKALMPSGVIKWVLEHTPPPTPTPPIEKPESKTNGD